MDNTQTDRIIRTPAVLAMIGNCSRSSVWRWEKAGEFPKRIKIGTRAMGWKLSDIKEWIETREKVDGE